MGMRYGDFKKRIAEAVIARLEPIQRRYRQVTSEAGYIDSVLKRSREHVLPITENTLRKVKSSMGLYA